jgi:hypothetical protein
MLRIAGAAIAGTSPGAQWPFAKPKSRPNVPFTQEPSRIVIDFDGDVDQASVVLGTSVTVEEVATGAPVPGGVGFPDPAKPNTMVFQAAGTFQTAAGGRFYRMRLSGDLPTPIVSTTGVRLDGEPTPAWPTGIGGPGGSYTLVFKVV